MHHLQRRCRLVIDVSPSRRHGKERVGGALAYGIVGGRDKLHVGCLHRSSLLATSSARRFPVVLLHGSLISVAMLAEHGKEESFATAHSRQEAISGYVAYDGWRYAPLRLNRQTEDVSTKLRGYPLHVLLILVRIKRTRGIDEQSAGTQTRPDVAYYLALQSPAVVDVLTAPFRYGSLVLAEHSLAGAGHVGKDGVKHDACLAVIAWIIVGYDDVFMTELLYVLTQNLHTCAHRLVGEEKASLGQSGSQSC